MTKIRKQVMAAIIDVMRAAKKRCEGEREAAGRAFPGTPDAVLWEALPDVDMEEQLAWWKIFERTIEGEVIKDAIRQANDDESAL